MQKSNGKIPGLTINALVLAFAIVFIILSGCSSKESDAAGTESSKAAESKNQIHVIETEKPSLSIPKSTEKANTEESAVQSQKPGNESGANIKKDSFERYTGLIGLKKEEIIGIMEEIPAPVDEGGLEFRKAGIRVWFDRQSNIAARQIWTQNKDIDFNGAKIGDKLDKFVEIFGKPEVKDDGKDEYGGDIFKYKNVCLNIGYDTKTGITYSAYILPETVSFLKYTTLLGLNREKVIDTMGETPDEIDDGLQFRKAAIGVWFSVKAGKASAENILTKNEYIDFNGAKIGDEIDKFTEFFGKPIKLGKDDNVSFAVYKYKNIYLAVTYLAETKLTDGVRIYSHEGN